MKNKTQIFYHLWVLFGAMTMGLAGCSDSFQDLGPDPSDTFVKFHGGLQGQEAADFVPLGNGFLLLGSTETSSLGSNEELYLVETDGGGNEVSTMIIGTPVPNSDGKAHSIIATADNGFLIAATLTSGNGNTDGWMLKMDQNRNVVWSKNYGARKSNETGIAAVETANGDIYLLGSTDQVDLIKVKGETPISDLKDMLLVKVDPTDGSMVWEKTFGYTGTDEGADMLDLGDGTLALLGTTDYPKDSLIDNDILLVIVNEDGNPVNSRHFGDPNNNETAGRLVLTKENNLTIIGNSNDNLFFLSVSQSLDKIIASAEISVGANAMGRALIQGENGNIIITGHAGMGESQDLLLLEVNGSGTIIWGPEYFGDEGEDSGVAVLPMQDRIFILGTVVFGTDRMMGFIKTNEKGKLTP